MTIILSTEKYLHVTTTTTTLYSDIDYVLNVAELF